MNTTELIQKIRNEIERQISDLPDTWSGSPAAKWAFEALLSFLDTQEEAAMNIARDVCKQLPNGEEKDGIVYYAILAAIAGAKWQKEQMLKDVVEISYKGGTARINGEEKPFEGGTVRIIIVKEDKK